MIRVLVVDDDFMVARVHSGFVSRTPGFTVVGVVHTGADALRAVAELRPDLVLLDIYLPDMTGIDVLRRLRGGDETDVDVLVVTAAREADTIQQALRGGAVHYIVKPFDHATLRQRLEHYAELRRGLAGLSTAAQADVDRVFDTRAGSPARAHLPKGLTAETAELVERALRESAANLSATECATLTGLSRVSARRYLEHFAAAGKAEVRLRYGTVGRPERRYRWRDG